MKPTNSSTQTAIEAKRAERRRRRRRRQMVRTAVVLSVVLVFLAAVAVGIMFLIGSASSKRGDTTSFMAVKAITVEGDSRYTDEQIIEASGLYVGQSLFGVNKAKAHDRLLETFPYLAYVEVRNSSFTDMCITVQETAVMGAVQIGERWMVVGENNHALELLEAADLPADILRIQGAGLQGEAIGRPLLDQRGLGVCRTLLDAAKACELTGISTIDMTKKTNVQFWWKEQVRVVLGNESQLATQVEAFADLLPTLLKNNGDTVSGRLDMSTYSDDDVANDKAIFTPADLLVSEPEEPEELPTEENGDSTTTTVGGNSATADTTTSVAH